MQFGALLIFSLALAGALGVSPPLVENVGQQQIQLDALLQEGSLGEKTSSFDVQQPQDFLVMEPLPSPPPYSPSESLQQQAIMASPQRTADLQAVDAETAAAFAQMPAYTPSLGSPQQQADSAQVAVEDVSYEDVPAAAGKTMENEATVPQLMDSPAESIQPQHPPAASVGKGEHKDVSGGVSRQAVVFAAQSKAQVLPAQSKSQALAAKVTSRASKHDPRGPEQSQTRDRQSVNAGQSLNLVSIHEGTSSRADADITSTRPGAAGATADVVTFGLFAKQFFGANLKGNTFAVDSVMLLKWHDPRAAAKVPAGMSDVTLSGKQAMKSVWMPEIVVTNRDIRKYEIISTSVTITSTGDVTKVERAGVVCNNIYDLKEYPFDTQKLNIKVASSKYMLDELVLKPDEDKSVSGVNKDIFESFPYDLDGWKVYAFDETDGALQKSRGVLEIQAKRTLGGYRENHLMPTFMLVIISWGVFWFPFQNPFITPRLALSILALLSFTTLMLKSSSELPDGAPANWNDIFNQQVQAMMFCTIVLNIFSEICKHQHDLEALGMSLNHEAKVVMPCLSITIFTIVVTAGAYKWLSLSLAGALTKSIIFSVMVLYLSHGVYRLQVAKAEKLRADEEKVIFAEAKKLEESKPRAATAR